MSGILSSLPGSSRGFGPLPQLFHAEAVFSIPQQVGIRGWRLHSSSEHPLYKSCRVCCLFSLFYPKLPCWCFHTAAPIPVQSIQGALGLGEGLLWGLTPKWLVLGGSELHLQPNLPQAVTGAV